MRDNPCQHKVLTGLTVARCLPHSEELRGIEVWAWSPDPMLPPRCPCEAGFRFFVATEEADPLWAPGADIVLGGPQPSLQDARMHAGWVLIRFPGCRLVAVPTRDGTVFRTRDQQFVLAGEQICGVCLYPWIIAGPAGTPRSREARGPG